MNCTCGNGLPEHTGTGRKPRYCSETCKQKAKRVREREKRVERLREQRSRLFIVPCGLDLANAFVTLLHRHNKKVPGAKFCLGVVDASSKLRGVAIIGRPIARMLQDGFTLEVNRVCTDGCPNTCSVLYAAARKVTFELGYHRLITYTLVTESGSSMRGAGWKKVRDIESSDGWLNRPDREKQAVYQVNKWRWETLNPMKGHPTEIILPEILEVVPETQQLDLFT